MIETALLIGLVVIALAIIGLVLLQQGKGADLGASFGSGASQTLFGSQGSGNFLTRSTWVLAFVFFGLCLGLAVIARDKAENSGRIQFETPAEEQVVETPVQETEIPVVEEEAAAESEIPQVEVEVQQTEEEVPQVEEAAVEAVSEEPASAETEESSQ